jgi:hypothetical protein
MFKTTLMINYTIVSSTSAYYKMEHMLDFAFFAFVSTFAVSATATAGVGVGGAGVASSLFKITKLI